MLNTLLIAQFSQKETLGILGVAAAILIGMTAIGFIILVAKQYKRCPSNRILVI